MREQSNLIESSSALNNPQNTHPRIAPQEFTKTKAGYNQKLIAWSFRELSLEESEKRFVWRRKVRFRTNKRGIETKEEAKR